MFQLVIMFDNLHVPPPPPAQLMTIKGVDRTAPFLVESTLTLPPRIGLAVRL